MASLRDTMFGHLSDKEYVRHSLCLPTTKAFDAAWKRFAALTRRQKNKLYKVYAHDYLWGDDLVRITEGPQIDRDVFAFALFMYRK